MPTLQQNHNTSRNCPSLGQHHNSKGVSRQPCQRQAGRQAKGIEEANERETAMSETTKAELTKRIGASQEGGRKELIQLLFDLRAAKDQMLANPDMCAPQALLVNPILKLEEILNWGERWKQEQEATK